jgi:hypothetical protein
LRWYLNPGARPLEFHETRPAQARALFRQVESRPQEGSGPDSSGHVPGRKKGDTKASPAREHCFWRFLWSTSRQSLLV